MQHNSLMNLDLSDAEAEALTQELAGIIDGARYPLFSPDTHAEGAPTTASPEPRVYEPPSRGRYRRRG